MPRVWLALGRCRVALRLQLLPWERGLIHISWQRWQQLGAELLQLGVGRKRGAPAPDLPFRSRQPLFLSFRLSSLALKLPSSEKPSSSFIFDSAPQLPAPP